MDGTKECTIRRWCSRSLFLTQTYSPPGTVYLFSIHPSKLTDGERSRASLPFVTTLDRRDEEGLSVSNIRLPDVTNCLCVFSYQYFGYVLRTIVYSVFKVLPKEFITVFRFILRSFSEAGHTALRHAYSAPPSGASKANAGAMVGTV